MHFKNSIKIPQTKKKSSFIQRNAVINNGRIAIILFARLKQGRIKSLLICHSTQWPRSKLGTLTKGPFSMRIIESILLQKKPPTP